MRVLKKQANEEIYLKQGAGELFDYYGIIPKEKN